MECCDVLCYDKQINIIMFFLDVLVRGGKSTLIRWYTFKISALIAEWWTVCDRRHHYHQSRIDPGNKYFIASTHLWGQWFVLVLYITSQYNVSHDDVILIITRVWQIVFVIVLVGSQWNATHEWCHTNNNTCLAKSPPDSGGGDRT